MPSGDLDPAALVVGLCHGVNRLFYPKTVFECDDGRRLTGNRANEFAAFDDLQVVEAEAVARCRNETIIRPMGRCRQDLAEALLGDATISLLEFEFVHALLIESDRSARAIDL
jgi:hypothetical protein